MTAAERPTVGKSRAGRVVLHGVVLLGFALSFVTGTGEGIGSESFGGRVALAFGAFAVAAALHGLLVPRLGRGPLWLRNVMAVLMGGIAFGALAVLLGVWSWPDAPTRVLGLGMVYGLFATLVPSSPGPGRPAG